MAVARPISLPKHRPTTLLHSNFLPPPPSSLKPFNNNNNNNNRNQSPTPNTNFFIAISCSSPKIKIVRIPSLDRNIVKQNKIRFVQKLKTLLLSKPKHYFRLQILPKCRSYLSLPKPRSLLSMINRYPSIFQLFSIPTPPSSPSSTCTQLCVRLTPAAAAIAAEESALKSSIATKLAAKLQKLLMLATHHRLLLSKLVHLAPDLGLPPNFRSRLCNDYPDRFKTVDTSYGRALELVSWDPELAVPIPPGETRPAGLIVDRPLKFKHLRLRKGLNLKRRHREFLIKFQELPTVSPYSTPAKEFLPESMEAEKRACAVVREVLGMMVEKRTLVDHLTHFRKDFGLSNKLRGMLVRHPELFYVSLKGQRDSVFLVEGYDDKGGLVEKDELLVAKERLMELVREAKRMRREKRKDVLTVNDDGEEEGEEEEEAEDDGFEDLFGEAWEDYSVEEDDDERGEPWGAVRDGEFWTVEAASSAVVNSVNGGESLEHW
ncbi:protein WHAT'S THIS FACTOR 1 homolog, chloroplastic [Telopea speciosissima]|uniref:protein WHAT'S THIS FACTOR 1 homolog, chloroplastic n=1 Tax=Telopea speciosissima TaxID=54955 RepID=UPI001CC67E4D|nr:protein WHAT'S THIS FACTOR 1 homolog, chloroplastic [Telopea speciosissima]